MMETLAPRTAQEQKIVVDFGRLYWSNPEQTWRSMLWQGVPCRKAPTDLWIYQEIIRIHRPDTIIETGTFAGGSALFMAHMMDLAGVDGQIITIDIRHECPLPVHPKVHYLLGGSTDRRTISKVEDMARGKTMVVLDSDHSWNHVAMEMELYSGMVTPGQYLIVEDTNIEYSPNYKGIGPKRAVDEFLPEHPDFRVIRNCERLLLTQNPGGFLLKDEKPQNGRNP